MATGRVQRWGLWKDERLVGFVEVVGRPPLLWISRLGVHKTFQGQGYGQQVLEKLIGQLRRNRRIAELRAAVHAENLPARRLFEKLGFSQLSQEAVDNELIYALSLR
ncbi:MAG: GNAT family N-acetyltransferase [Bacteroidia bacterium]|nr:GNAT family N-acetyltransferase [Bacteroidia bacterium]MDW8134114.1 GNAT family N-acetyltransferase [Bacteroidia bacterium]